MSRIASVFAREILDSRGNAREEHSASAISDSPSANSRLPRWDWQ